MIVTCTALSTRLSSGTLYPAGKNKGSLREDDQLTAPLLLITTRSPTLHSFMRDTTFRGEEQRLIAQRMTNTHLEYLSSTYQSKTASFRRLLASSFQYVHRNQTCTTTYASPSLRWRCHTCTHLAWCCRRRWLITTPARRRENCKNRRLSDRWRILECYP
jgi:hypothetical protein